MADCVDQAQAAARQADWPNFVYCLQQLFLTNRQASLTEAEQETLLALALESLGAADFQEQWDVAKLVPKFGTAAIAPLIALAQDDTAELEARWFAVRILGASQNPQAIAALIDLLHEDSDDDLTAAAAEALAELGATTVTVFEPLLADPTLKGLAVKALAQIRHSATIAPLLSVVQDADPALRATAIEALSSFHNPQIPPVLLKALQDPASAVRQAAIAGLAVRADVAQELQLVEHLAPCLWDVDLGVCRRAIAALGRLGQDSAIAPLAAVLRSVSTPIELKQEAIRALSWLQSAAALTALQQPLNAPDTPTELCLAIITALGRWENPTGHTSAAQTLVSAIANPTLQAAAPLRQALAIALGQLQQPDSLPTLLALLSDPDPAVSLHAIAALKTFDPAIALPRLQAWPHPPTLPAPLQAQLETLIRTWSQLGS